MIETYHPHATDDFKRLTDAVHRHDTGHAPHRHSWRLEKCEPLKAVEKLLATPVCFPGGVSNFAQNPADAPVTLSSATTLARPGTFIVARTHSGP